MTEELANNHLQDALHFKPLPPKPLPIDEIVEIENEIKKPGDSTTNSIAFKGISLKDYESQRRMVEEQNKQKKEILYRAIEQQWVFFVLSTLPDIVAWFIIILWINLFVNWICNWSGYLHGSIVL